MKLQKKRLGNEKKKCDWSRKQSSEMGSKNKSLWKKSVNIDRQSHTLKL